jgi:hypothetical protein
MQRNDYAHRRVCMLRAVSRDARSDQLAINPHGRALAIE